VFYAVFWKLAEKAFRARWSFPPHGIRALVSKFAYLFIAHSFVRHKQQEKPIFFRQGIERLLDTLSQFFRFQDSERSIRLSYRAFPNRFVRIILQMPMVPGLQQIVAVIDGDAIQPGSQSGIAAKLAELAEKLSGTHHAWHLPPGLGRPAGAKKDNKPTANAPHRWKQTPATPVLQGPAISWFPTPRTLRLFPSAIRQKQNPTLTPAAGRKDLVFDATASVTLLGGEISSHRDQTPSE
jgi:hypothetical protein